MSKEIIKQLINEAPIKEIYADLLQPGMKKAGEALGTILDGANTVLLPLKLVNAKSRLYFDKNIQNYSNKLEQNTDLSITNVPQYVGNPIIDKLIYLEPNELAEAFINLLTKASFKETLKYAHPVYLTILNNLSSDEAKILFHYKNIERIPLIDIYIHRYIERIPNPKEDNSMNIMGIDKIKKQIEYAYQNRESVHIKAAFNLTSIPTTIQLDFPENIDIYIENLAHNGIISFERTIAKMNDIEEYKNITENIYKKEIKDIEDMIQQNETEYILEMDIRRGYIEFSELGKGFINACIKDIEI